MYIFSSSTRNQHPNHGVVAGAEKPRRRKKETPATATSSENQIYCCGRPTNAGLEYLDVNKTEHVVEVKVVTTLGKVLDGIMEKLHKTLFRWS